ncbi:hypothetical protein KKC47_01205, partial [Patescibacteria group bacterium]|nr:hypothetical protein [Patescibacteria group bacterium]
MPKWKIFIPVAIVILVGIIAYLQVTSALHDNDSLSAGTESADEVIEVKLSPLDVTGDEEVEAQIEAWFNELLRELRYEADTIGFNNEDIKMLIDGESDNQLLDVEY